MVKNFRYEIENKIARSGAPQSATEVDWLYDQGVRTIVSLHPVPEEASLRMGARGIDWLPLLTEGFAEGAPEGFRAALDYIQAQSQDRPAVLIHCQGGGGRAGTMFAAYLLSQGVPAQEVLQRVSGIDRPELHAFINGVAAGLGQRG